MKSCHEQADQRQRTAEHRIGDATENIRELEEKLADELNEITETWGTKATRIEQVDVGLEKTDIVVDEIVLTWIRASLHPTQRDPTCELAAIAASYGDSRGLFLD